MPSENAHYSQSLAAAATPGDGGTERRSTGAQLLSIIEKGRSVIGLLIVCVVFGILADGFVSQYNFFNILRQSSVTAILAAGMVFVIVTAGIDLSVGSVVAVAGIVTAGVLSSGSPAVVGILAGLAVGGVFGLVNGFVVSYIRIPPFIATLGTMTIGSSLALAYSGGLPISGLPKSFTWIGQGMVGTIPVPVIIAAIVVVVAAIVLHKTLIGRYATAIGSNEHVAYLSGINTRRWKMIVYSVNGLLAGMGGVVLTARQNSGEPTAGLGIELTVIAAVVIGGTSLSGGKGAMIGAVIGTLLMTVINNGLNLMNVSPYYQGLFVGGLILAAVALDRRKTK
ncbi:ABC transporter permease [Neorhizobium sp. NCHU2750]|uniref:ABC transporter permease n=1 Tax=Neorhizobium sp. NCHU2750 TaxID=1825976 RepID=UPI000E76C4DD|nr:ribose ABC transporter permease [Neorhizobium sp. NCHU2750]